MQNDYQTPLKSQNGGDGASTIAHGLTDNKGMVQSKIEHREDQASQKNEQDRILDSIQSQIKQIGQQLQSLHYQMKKQADKYSENSLNMEHRRNQLRKRLIDLDYQHKSIFARRIKESRRHEQQEKQNARRQYEQKQRARRQQREQKQRLRKQQLDKYQQQYRQKLRATFQTSRLNGSERIDASQKKSQQPSEQTPAQNSQNAQESKQERAETSNNVQDELARSRRRLRIAQIQAELAESRLRRSRLTDLNSELYSLRYSYLDPYYVYRPYSLPSYYYPYSAYPVYSRWWLY